MDRKLIVEFAKMSGAGNDFIVVDNRFYHFSDEELAKIAQKMCPRRQGIGADGILALASATHEGYHYRMRYVNADGSVGTMCGNGARCLARYAGITEKTLCMETDAGGCTIFVPADRQDPVRIFVPEPEHWKRQQMLQWTIPPNIVGVHYLWTGTEHVVCFVDDVQATPVSVWGAAIRHDPMLAPAGANVNFVEVLDASDALRVRTFEKGVEAETLACGTGALASVLTAHRVGRIKGEKVAVHMPGGVLGIGLNPLYLEGPATTIYRGTFEW